MYQKKINEAPRFTVAICYYDTTYVPERFEQILNICKKYQFYPPAYHNAGRFTRGRFVKFKPEKENLLHKAFTDPHEWYLSWAQCPGRVEKEICKITLMMMKFSRPVKITPRNVLMLDITYDKLKNADLRARYLDCVRELIVLLDPWYAEIDDISVKTDFCGAQSQEAVNYIAWGNYFGAAFCEKYLSSKIRRELPRCEKIGNGIYFQLSDDLLDFASKECHQHRQRLSKLMHLKPMPANAYEMTQENLAYIEEWLIHQ